MAIKLLSKIWDKLTTIDEETYKRKYRKKILLKDIGKLEPEYVAMLMCDFSKDKELSELYIDCVCTQPTSYIDKVIGFLWERGFDTCESFIPYDLIEDSRNNIL